MNFGEITIPEKQETFENKFKEFISRFPGFSEERRNSEVKGLLEAAAVSPESFSIVMAMADKYLYDISSPVMNEEYYLPFMEFLLSSSAAEDYEKERAEFIIGCIKKNRVGEQATNFLFTDREGNEGSLHDTFRDRNTLLVFFDPECENCRLVLRQLKDDLKLLSDVENGKTGILAIYSGHDIESWEKLAGSLPDEWIIGIEPGIIEDQELYDFMQMPTLYLLDQKKKVLKKNLRINLPE